MPRVPAESKMHHYHNHAVLKQYADSSPGRAAISVGASSCNDAESRSESDKMSVSFSCRRSVRNLRPWYDGVLTLPPDNTPSQQVVVIVTECI